MYLQGFHILPALCVIVLLGGCASTPPTTAEYEAVLAAGDEDAQFVAIDAFIDAYLLTLIESRADARPSG